MSIEVTHFQKMLVISFRDYYINNADNKYCEKGSKTRFMAQIQLNEANVVHSQLRYDAFAN